MNFGSIWHNPMVAARIMSREGRTTWKLFECIDHYLIFSPPMKAEVLRAQMSTRRASGERSGSQDDAASSASASSGDEAASHRSSGSRQGSPRGPRGSPRESPREDAQIQTGAELLKHYDPVSERRRRHPQSGSVDPGPIPPT